MSPQETRKPCSAKQFSAARARSRLVAVTVVFLLPPALAVFAASFEAVRTNQPGWTITWEGQVEFVGPQKAPVPVRTNQFLHFGDALQTLALSRAVVRLQDWSDLRLKDRTRLEISLQPTPVPSPGIKLDEGQIYFTSRGGPQAIPVETPHARGVPKGTEFLVRVDAAQTEITMFDGEVELSNGVDSKPVRTGQQGVAVPGQPIQIRPILEAQNIVQWWIYYPAVLDPDELRLAPAEQTALAESLAAYRSGNLLVALRSFPGHPVPIEPASDAQRSYLAALFLSVGAVEQAGALLTKSDSNAPPARALRAMIAAVQNKVGNEVTSLTSSSSTTNSTGKIGDPLPLPRPGTDVTTSEMLALSYAHQATNNLKFALAAARAAAARSPGFGFGWARVAELEFSFGHIRTAREAVERALKLSPENAQAHAVRGFLLAAENKLRDAVAAFERAIEIDPALGNAWLGRGLCKRRLGWFGSSRGNETLISESKIENRKLKIENPDWLSDLQTAAALEPRRSLVRSYAGKAFSDSGEARLAQKEFHYAKQLDLNDPTPWLYSALDLWQENRPNEAVRDLERSISLNDNRAVYRSRLLLDQDRASRGAGLAKIYQSAGLDEVALSEAARAVSYDYANHSAHQFLAESYNALRDPTRFNLRYETVWFNELLLANLLSPVGAGLLSQNISQQEYSRLFEANRLGLLTSTEYRSDGQFREIASHYGLLGRTSYTLDLDYQHNEGNRPNNDLRRIEWYSQFKQQLNDRDSAFLLTKYQDYESGDNFQHYDPGVAQREFRLHDDQSPIIIGALHRQWRPQVHTTILGGYLESDQRYALFSPAHTLPVVQTNDLVAPGISQFVPTPFPTLRYRSQFSAQIFEVNQVATFEHHTLVGGASGQFGRIHTRDFIDTANPPDAAFFGTPIETGIDEDFWRASIYAYDLFRPSAQVQITAGVSYDHLQYPANFRFPPLSPGRSERMQWSPKAGLQWDPLPSVTIRGAYAQALGGVTFDQSVRLEPTQVAGFAQAFRNVISEAEVGSVTAPRYTVGGAAVDWSPGRDWHAGVRWDRITSDVRQEIGAFYNPGTGARPLPGLLREQLNYHEDTIRVHASKLLNDEWSLRGHYRLTLAEARFDYPDVPPLVLGAPIFEFDPARQERSRLHELGLRCSYNDASGFFAGVESLWFIQENSGYPNPVHQTARPGDTVNQINVSVGWRFWQRRAELTFSALNMAGDDYRLNSLTPYHELPRERVFLVRLRLGW